MGEHDKKKLTQNERLQIEERIKFLDMQQYAIKIIINSLYGAFGNKNFYFYDPDIAQSITVQGQDLIKFAIKALNHYARNKWHLDTELHEKLGLSEYKINQVESDVAIYADTDSIEINAIINTNIGDYTFADLFNKCISDGARIEVSPTGHIVLYPENLQVLNYENDKIVWVGVKQLIKHKVIKKKWRIKTKSGKELYITEDHSCIVFRDSVKLEIKPKDILPTDKILIIKSAYQNK
jgi:hypothetical protein